MNAILHEDLSVGELLDIHRSRLAAMTYEVEERATPTGDETEAELIRLDDRVCRALGCIRHALAILSEPNEQPAGAPCF